jgi:pyruvate formate lyase activating enzyme
LGKCHQSGIHTCLETSGFASEPALRQVLAHTNYLLYDLKHMNSEKHHLYTGKPNSLILSNARIVAASGIETLFRMPLVPGVNDDMQNIKETAEFLHGLGDNALRIELMPYHRLGKGKYESLGKEYSLSEIIAPEPREIDSVKNEFEKFDITCTVSR